MFLTAKVSEHDSEEELASPRRGKAGTPRQTTKRLTSKTGTPKATSRDTKRKSSAAASRPKSAPKFRGQKQKGVTEDDDGSSEVPEVDEYSSVQDESSEEDIPLPEEEEVEEELGESEASEVSEDESLRDGHRINKVR